MSNIQCSGCGGLHPRPGGSRCRHMKEKRINLEDSDLDSDDEVGANPNSIVAWSSILSKEEMAAMPPREDLSYMELCERTIADLTHQLESASQSQRVEKAENRIASLMAKLKIGQQESGSEGKLGAGMHDRNRTPTRGRGDTWKGDYYYGDCASPSPVPGFKNVVESSDTKEYLGRLRPESHLVPVKNYEAMNYRELVLGMAGVHAHLLQNGRPVYGYEQHCLFIKRKSASFLYSNLASTLYDRYVTDKVISGEFWDYPSSCSDAALEFFCDSYRRDIQNPSTVNPNGKSGTKPWSGYPYPYCFFYNECNACVKKSCGLKHECGYCHTPDHKSKECSKSLWKKSPTADTGLKH